MICTEKARRVEEHHQATLASAHAVMELNRVRPTCLLLEYRQLRLAAEEARIKSQDAGLALTRHVEEHGC